MANTSTIQTTTSKPATVLERISRTLILKSLSSLSYGQIKISEGVELTTFGTSRPGEPKATIVIKSPRMWERIVFGGTLGAAESYMDGDWSADHLVDVIRIFCGNRETMSGMDGGLALIKWPILKAYHLLRRDTVAGAKKNIAAHYDLGDDFFATWLDPTMTYSCGIFPSANATMHSASLHKIQTLCEKLVLKPTDHLLEIGTGWGAFALFAAANYGCKVTTTTISKNQFQHVRAEVQKLNLSHLIDVQFCDYRNLTGTYDKIISVEMIEAVGHSYFDTYFAKVSRLLKPDGLAAIQAITIRDQFYDNAVKNVDFIQRYIFPGSTIPSIARMLDCVRDNTDMTLENLEDYTPHYARTIHAWREKFWQEEQTLRTLGCSDAMMRMWDYYFAYCEGGFHEHVIGMVQMVFSKPKYRAEKG